jgi:CysZ protein
MMFFKELLLGIKTYNKSVQIINRYRLWYYLLIPGIMSFILILLIIFLGIIFLPGISHYIHNNMIPDFLKGDIVLIITIIFLWIILLFISFMIYKYIVLILFSPVLSTLSEKIEKLIYNQPEIKLSLKNFIRDFFRGIIINLRSIVREIIFTFFAWIFILIPGIGPLMSTAFIFLIQSFYGGFGLVDYTLERKRYSLKRSIKYSKENRGSITGIGVGFILLLMVPIVGWFTAPAFATVAATLNTLEKINQKENRQYLLKNLSI